MSQKIENILNLALDATEDERARSGELDIGYDPVTKEWEVIVKYSGAGKSHCGSGSGAGGRICDCHYKGRPD